MKFNEGAGLDTSQVQDRRGSGGGSGGGLGGLGGVAAGGGGLGLVAVVIFVLIQMFSGGGSSSGSSGSSGSGVLDQMSGQSGTADNSQLSESCRTGADANTKDDCAAVAIINSVQAYWTDAMSNSGTTYNPAETVFYSGSTPTGCGTGTSGMGPFYCPTDKTVYVDLSFWNDLKTQFGADSGTFTQAYVLAHEYGHHVQDVLGTSDRVGTGTGPTSGSVRLELQADCYAGAWAKHATTVPGSDGKVLITDITQNDVNAAIDTAGKIGDDWIQTHLGNGQVDPSSFSHGTAAQRQKWFTTGWDSGDPAKCDTFAAKTLG